MKKFISRSGVTLSLLIIIVSILHSVESCTWIHDNFTTSEVINAQPIPPFRVPPQHPQQSYLQFLVVGDAGTGGIGQREVGQAMAEKASKDSAAFVLYLGDNFYESGVQSVSDPQWKTKFEDIYWQPSLQIPFYAVLGNHDYRSNPQAQVEYTTKSTRWRMRDRFYTFSYQIDDTTQAEFFCLDTNPLSSLSPTDVQALPESSTATRQLRWLEQSLSASTAQWKIALGHHPLYSGGEHGDNEDLIASLEPLFLKLNLDLYLCGHDHHQELLKPIKGVHYIISGAGGKHRDVTWRENTMYAATNLGFTLFRISTDELLVEFFNRNGKLEYAYAIKK